MIVVPSASDKKNRVAPTTAAMALSNDVNIGQPSWAIFVDQTLHESDQAQQQHRTRLLERP